ncbi:MAG: holin [Ruminococcaceae bacterium]|nr:holin [Oscillospiraceae bacterium]
MTDITSIVEAVIALAVTVITVFLIPWISGRTTAQEREELLGWADIAVAAAQQLYHKCSGSQRLDYALAFLQEKGFDIDDGIVVDAVEAAVLKLHRQLEGTYHDG